MSQQAGRQQAGDDAAAETGLCDVGVIGVIWIYVPGDADEGRRVGLGQGSAERDFLADANGAGIRWGRTGEAIID